MTSHPPLSQSFVWCGALQSAWSQQILHRMLSHGWTGNLHETPFDGRGFSPSGLSSFADRLTEAQRSQLCFVSPKQTSSIPNAQTSATTAAAIPNAQTSDTTTEVLPIANAVLFWEIPSTQASDLRVQTNETWGELFAAFTQFVSLLRAWDGISPDQPAKDRPERRVFLLWPEQGPLERPQDPWPALVEAWSRSLVEQWAHTLEQEKVSFFSLPFGTDIDAVIEKINTLSTSFPATLQMPPLSQEAEKMQRIHTQIRRIIGSLRGLLLHFRTLQTHIERFGFLRRQRLAQRFYKLSGLRLLDWETQIQRMITGWGHLLQVHNLRLLPSFLRDRLQADQKIAQRLRPLLSTLLHFPQEQDAPQKEILSALCQDRDALFATIQRFLRELDTLDALWKESALVSA